MNCRRPRWILQIWSCSRKLKKERTSWRFLKRSLRCWSSTSMNPSPRWPFSSIRSKKGSWKSNYRMWRSSSMASRVFLQKKRLWLVSFTEKEWRLSSGSMPVKKPIGQVLERAIFTRPVLTFSSSWQRLLRYSLSIVGKRSKTLLVALPAC